MPGHRRLLFLRLVRLVSTAPRAQTPAKEPRGRQRGHRPAGSGGAAGAGDDDASVPSARGVLTVELDLQVNMGDVTLTHWVDYLHVGNVINHEWS